MEQPLPSFDVVTPSGERVTVHPRSGDTVGALLVALDLPAHGEVLVDDRPVHVGHPLVGALHHGAVLGRPGGGGAALMPSRAGPGLNELRLGPAPGRIEGLPSGRFSGDGDDRGVAASFSGEGDDLGGGSAPSVEGDDLGEVSAPTGKEHCGVMVGISSGPACAPPVRLTVGRHVVGRARDAGIRIADPAVELHHGVLDVDERGTVAFTQLSGRVAARIDGLPATPGQRFRAGSSLAIGASALDHVDRRKVVDRPVHGSVELDEHDPWRRVVRRGPSFTPLGRPEPIALPEPPARHPRPAATGLIGAAVGIVAAAVIAVVLGQVLFALFAAVGAVASLATWLVGAVSARRRRVRARRAFDDGVDDLRTALEASRRSRATAHRARMPTLIETLAMLEGSLGRGASTALWTRRRTTDGTCSVAVGTGNLWSPPPIDHDVGRHAPDLDLMIERSSVISGVGVPLELGERSVVAVVGPRAFVDALARATLVQLAAWYGPADWAPLVVTDRPQEWCWVDWLPHTAGSAGVVGLDQLDRLDRFAGSSGRLLAVFVDAPGALASRSAPLRRFLDRSGAASVVLAPSETTVPAVCGEVLTIGATGALSWRCANAPDDTPPPPLATATSVRASGLDRAAAGRHARRLAVLLDPEEDDADDRAVPDDVALVDVDPGLDGTPSAVSWITNRWLAGGRDPAPEAAVGRSADGVVTIDLVRDGPHGLIAGTTGAGKSELLRTVVVSMAATVSPDHLTFVLVDYKGGSTFDRCVDLPHTVGLVTDLDDGLAERALISLDAELNRRERALREVGAGDLADYRSRSGVAALPRLVVVVDEFAALAKELPEFLASLLAVAQRGRSLGVHLLLATQRPAGVVSDDIRANTNLRMALRLTDTADAVDVVGDDAPSRLPRHAAGRVALRRGADDLVNFQAARCSMPPAAASDRLRVERHDPRGTCVDRAERPPIGEHSELAHTVAAVQDAARRLAISPPRRPWQPPLPDRVDPAMVDEVVAAAHRARRSAPDRPSAVGIVDDPGGQRRRPLRWRPEPGNLALIGSLGSGTTSTLVTLGRSLASTRPPSSCHLYAVDATGDSSLGCLGQLEHCAGVVGTHERERVARLLGRLGSILEQRIGGDERSPTVVLLVDGLPSLRATLSGLEDVRLSSVLDRVLLEGPSLGISTCFTADGSSVLAASAPAAERWIFHLDDPDAVSAIVGRATAVPPGRPGRLRVASSGLLGQVVDPIEVSAPPRWQGATGGPAPLEILPQAVRAGDLNTAPAEGDELPDRPTAIAIGIGSDDLDVAHLEVPHGDHVLVAGLARTGRSTALDQVVRGWCSAVGDGRVVHVTRSRPPWPADVAGAGRILLAVDDADRVEDVNGTLGAVLDGAHPHVTIAAAARLDSVRSSYGHWTRDVARSRCGLIMTAVGEIDGDLLGVTLPRRTIVAPRPGLGWLVDGQGARLVQVACEG